MCAFRLPFLWSAFSAAVFLLSLSLAFPLCGVAASNAAADDLFGQIEKTKNQVTEPNREKLQKLCERFQREHPTDERAPRVLKLEHEVLCDLQTVLANDDPRLAKRLPLVERELLALLADKPVARYYVRALRLSSMPPRVSPKSTEWQVRQLMNAQRLAEEFPDLQEPYRTVLWVADRSDSETRAKMLHHLLTLPQVGPELKDKARAMLAGASVVSARAQEEAVRKARQDFQRGHPSPEKAAANLLGWARRLPAEQATELVRELLAKKDVPDVIEKSAIYYLRRLEQVGQRLDYRLESLDGRVFRDEQLRGKVVVIYFWSVPRRGNSQSFMATDVVAFAAQMKRLDTSDLVAIAYNLNDDPRAVRNFTDECRLGLPVVCDGRGLQGPFVRQLSLQTYPAAWVIDRRGRVREVQAEHRLPETVQALLEEPGI